MNIKSIVIALAILALVSGSYAVIKNYQSPQEKEVAMEGANDSEEDSTLMAKEDITMMDKKEEVATMEQEASSMDKEPDKAMEDKMVKGAYVTYSPQVLTDASKNGKAVLFFWAAWCPFCKSANEAFTSRANEIPDNVTVLKTDYDKEKELKTKYGVTYQHTFVQVDAQGNMLTKWNGGDLDALRANVK